MCQIQKMNVYVKELQNIYLSFLPGPYGNNY